MKAERTRIQEWMARLADGDRSAFEPLFAALSPLAERLARRLLRDAVEAEDAAQQALLAVFRRASEFDRDRDATAWVLGIVTYECRSARRRRVRRREEALPEEQEGGAVEAEAERAAIERDLLKAAESVVSSLRPEDAEAIRAALDGGRRPAISTAALRKRLQRALARLRLAWEVRHGAP